MTKIPLLAPQRNTFEEDDDECDSGFPRSIDFDVSRRVRSIWGRKEGGVVSCSLTAERELTNPFPK